MSSIDIAIMDVPTDWFIQYGSGADAAWFKNPQSSGYGMAPIKSWDVTQQSNKLKTIPSGFNTNTAAPTDKTIFDHNIAWVPIAFIANPGIGISGDNVTKAQLQYLFVTGRLTNGENLNVCTRDSGTGTRNGAMNSLGVDPSWARGDNVGKKLDTENSTKGYSWLGSMHKVSNLGGSSIMEGAVQNDRLAVGYTGFAGSSRAEGDIAGKKYEILNLDLIDDGEPNYIRPTLLNILNTHKQWGYRIGGPETMATVGDPYAAAGYLRNILDSIALYNDPCADQSTDYNIPGQFLATNFFLMASIKAVPHTLDPDVFVDNTNFLQNVYHRVLSTNTFSIPANSFVGAGKVPTRQVNTDLYRDGQQRDYLNAAGITLAAGATLNIRNMVCGDFLYDSVRNLNDIDKMMAAFSSPDTFETTLLPGKEANGYVCVEIIGDFNGTAISTPKISATSPMGWRSKQAPEPSIAPPALLRSITPGPPHGRQR